MFGLIQSRLFRTYFFGAMLVLVLGIAAVLGLKARQLQVSFIASGGEHVVTLREDGFYPRELTIQKGDKVTFTTTSDAYFWPASDLHPTHSLYPEFDPKTPIEPKKTWSFRFEKVGEWHYHDHLAPYSRGTVFVKDSSRSNQNSEKQCTLECWDKRIRETLRKQGLKAAFETLAQAYLGNSQAAENCHYLVHNLGLATYPEYVKRKRIELMPETHFCTFGFYHGFMEAFLNKTKDPQQARSFCEDVARKLGTATRDANLQCYHGIGHGAIETVDPTLWGDERAMVREPLKICEQVSDTEEKLYRCSSGIFNGIANFYISGDYKLNVNKEKPLWLCREQEARYKESCYGNMTAVPLLLVAKRDFFLAAKIIVDTVEENYSRKTMWYLAGDYAQRNINKIDHGKYSKECESLDEKFRTSCVTGFVMGLIEAGRPGEEYIEALRFCSAKALAKENSSACFESALTHFRNIYPPVKFRQVCQALEDEYNKKYCPL